MHRAASGPKQAKGGEAVIGLDEEQIKLSDLAGSGSTLPIDDDELSAAFDFFDIDGSGKITAAGLKSRLGAFYKNLPAKEIKLLLGDGVFTKDSLRQLLADNELGAYDPVKEAFKVYDPNGTGYVDSETLRGIFESLGYGEITDEDVAVLVETADVDRDSKISLDDFRHMLRFNKQPPSPERKPAAGGAS